MDKLELLVNKTINIIEEEYDEVRLNKNTPKKWVSVLEDVLGYINESDAKGDTPLGLWTATFIVLSVEYGEHKKDEYVKNKIEELEGKITRMADSLGF